MHESKIITLLGGSGFIGSYVAVALALDGHRLKIASRNPDKALFTKTGGMVGQVNMVHCNVLSPEEIEETIRGSDVVINLTGILYERGRERFGAIHARAAENVAQIAKKLGIPRLVHFSALGVDHAPRSKYARTKLNGEKAVQAAFPETTIIRPGLVFGPEDEFFNRFARYATVSPMLPLIGGGETKFQPVYVADVAKAVVRILQGQEYQGKIFELGGPKVYTFRELLELLLKALRRKRYLLPVPVAFAKYIVALPSQLLPRPFLTMDQVTLLAYDNIVSLDTRWTFKSLNIKPEKAEDIVPKYLERYKKI
jgi:NADH dehydrogenase